MEYSINNITHFKTPSEFEHVYCNITEESQEI